LKIKNYYNDKQTLSLLDRTQPQPLNSIISIFCIWADDVSKNSSNLKARLISWINRLISWFWQFDSFSLIKVAKDKCLILAKGLLKWIWGLSDDYVGDFLRENAIVLQRYTMEINMR